MPPQKIIIDTDPGCDDVLALLLAFCSKAEDLEVLLVSLAFGNVDIQNCLRNTVTLFHVLELERNWRTEQGVETGFESLSKFKPIVALGAECPLEGLPHELDHFHGLDGLGSVHTKAPHFTPTELWHHLFDLRGSELHNPPREEDLTLPPNFVPSKTPAHKEILRILKENPPHTVTIVPVGPLTNLALAAAEDPETFLLAKEVVVMGGALDVEGNVTPVGEFNTWADPFAAAYVYSLTSPTPSSTLPPKFSHPSLPEKLSRQLNVTLFPLDVTTPHLILYADFQRVLGSQAEKGSPLAQWANVFLGSLFEKMKELYKGEKQEDVDVTLHDPMCVWYVLQQVFCRGQTENLEEGVKAMERAGWGFEIRDFRVETAGQWTRGMCVVDNRRKKVEMDLSKGVLSSDRGVWLHAAHGNRVRVCTKTPWIETFGKELLGRVFGA